VGVDESMGEVAARHTGEAARAHGDDVAYRVTTNISSQ